MVNSKRVSDRQKKYFMGVDIGGTKIWLCITDMSGTIIYKKKAPTTSEVKELKTLIMDHLEISGIDLEEVYFISFGVPGATNSELGVVIDAPAFQWVNYPLKEKMTYLLSVPIFVNNDVNCAAYNEKWLGAAQDMQDFVFVAIGTGVGSAIVTNGQLVDGAHFMAGEIGYLVLEEDAEFHGKISEGQFGLFERKASGTSLTQYTENPEQLFVKYKNGDPSSIKIINTYINYLSIGLANVVSLLNPKKIILGGGVAESLDDLIPLINDNISKYTPVPFEVEQSKQGELAGVLGAIAFGREQETEWKK